MGKKSLNSYWEYYSPTFEFSRDLPIDSSAWSGHYFFAYDLVRNIKPKVIVELGTHKGNSLFSMAQAIKDAQLKTKLHAVDTWEGDSQAGFYGKNVYKDFLKISKKYYQDVDIIPHKMLFDDALTHFNDNSIDILHIDGLHTYEAVKHDFETWLPKVNKNTGTIMFHDVCERQGDFGVYRLWEELKKKYKDTITFEHYHGLGVVFFTKDTKQAVHYLHSYYSTKSSNQDLNYMLDQLEQQKRDLETEFDETRRILQDYKDKEIMWKKTEIMMKQYKKESDEFRSFKQGDIWKILEKYRRIKNSIVKICKLKKV